MSKLSNGPSSELFALQELTVDIVLTDYCMPEMTGYDLLKAIKVNHHHPLCIPHLTSTPVIFQSNWMLNPLNCQALSSPNPIPVVVMSSENEPQRISR